MIGLSFFILSFLCAPFIDAAESSASAQQPILWEQPALGSKEEAAIIEKASRITCTLHCGNKYHAVNAFLDLHFVQIQEKIKKNIDMRATLLAETNYKKYIPSLSPYKKLQYNNCDDTIDVKQNKSPAVSSGMWQLIKNLFFQNSDHTLKSNTPGPDHSELQLYVYKNCDQSIEIESTVDDGELEAGIAQRMQLYANLYNALSKRAGKECICSDHYLSDLCYLPVLQAELLGGICMQIAVQLNKRETDEGKRIKVADLAAFKAFIAHTTQEELQNKQNWEYQPIANKIAKYDKHIPLDDCCSQTKNLQGPFVLSFDMCHPIKYLQRDMTSKVGERNEGKKRDPAIPSRQLWKSSGQNCPHRRIRFSDDDWGYNLFLDFPHILSCNTFNIIAYNWISNKEINKCVFAYAHEYYEHIPDNTRPGGIRVEKRIQYGVGYADLPAWDMREYGIGLWPTHSYDNNDPASGVYKGLYQKRYETQCENKSLIEIESEITAIAYDPGLEHILFATGPLLKLWCINSTTDNQLSDLCAFEESIKKIFVVDDRMYLVYTEDGHIYRYFYGNADPVKLKFDLGKPIIDVAYDTTRRELAFLTKGGVYTCACHASQRVLEEKRKIGEHSIKPAIYDTSKWSLSLADTCPLVNNAAFNCKKYPYNAIDFQNGQIYVMYKTIGEYGYNKGRVLIYPPLTVVAVDSTEVNQTSSWSAGPGGLEVFIDSSDDNSDAE